MYLRPFPNWTYDPPLFFSQPGFWFLWLLQVYFVARPFSREVRKLLLLEEFASRNKVESQRSHIVAQPTSPGLRRQPSYACKVGGVYGISLSFIAFFVDFRGFSAQFQLVLEQNRRKHAERAIQACFYGCFLNGNPEN